MKLSKHARIYFLLSLGLLFIFGLWKKEKTETQFVREYISFKQVAELSLRDLPKREAWRRAAPKVVEISIPGKNAEPAQPALWYHSGSRKKKPLLLVLHSWSADYIQHYGIPYGVFAEKNDWIFIHPDYRGEFDHAGATASEKAIRDVLDALEYAKSHAPVDDKRIYLAGFSGGAMMSLIMIGRYPEQFSAAVIWVPVYDLKDWYSGLMQSRLYYAEQYRNDMEASCGGKPNSDAKAEAECRKRSPSAYLVGARGKGLKVFISGGIHDPFVPPSHAIRAFNDLAGDGHKIAEADYRFLDETGKLPEGLQGQGQKNRFFEEAGLPVVVRRSSMDATLILFDGGHDIVYNAGFEWLSQQHR
ncbi:MAG: dipeptidyl aminopeptidase [Desulfobacteraceae bacterium]|nr:MAG: dipeptidyl aminopeptidase [Desulfobacteraceae bacterium]